MPSTPTARRRYGQSTLPHIVSIGAEAKLPGDRRIAEEPRPSTPPRPSNQDEDHLDVPHGLSPLRTPKANKSLHVPSVRSTLRFDAPDFAEENSGDNNERSQPQDAMPKTPSRRPIASSSAGSSILPFTPRKMFSSPFTFSPFRTPSRRNVFDPADPGNVLDEELSALASNRQGHGLQDSPVGFFAHGKGLLYESPNLPSPGRWRPW